MAPAPNILFLMPDQLRPDFLRCYGADFIQTPNIDALAARGTRYETCISPSPICVPARASLLTGMSALANGVIDNVHWLRPDRHLLGWKTWPEILAESGYATYAIGKMHFFPWDRSEGFENRVIAEDKRHIHIADDYYVALKERGFIKQHARETEGYLETQGACTNDLPPDLQIDHWVSQQAIAAIGASDPDRPFAMMVGFPGPHCPYDPSSEHLSRIDADSMPDPISATPESQKMHDAFVALYQREWADIDYTHLPTHNIRKIRQHYAALVQAIDAEVGDIVLALKKAGRWDNTIVVFGSDHGDYLGDHGMVGKTFFHESSIRVPLIVCDNRKPEPCVNTSPVSVLDLFPSFLHWAGCPPSAQAMGQLLSQSSTEQRVITGFTRFGAMARSERWKLVRYANGNEALFDLENDPNELTNLIEASNTPRIGLDQAITRHMLGDTQVAHRDKFVDLAGAKATHPFFSRGWKRAYPCPSG